MDKATADSSPNPPSDPIDFQKYHDQARALFPNVYIRHLFKGSVQAADKDKGFVEKIVYWASIWSSRHVELVKTPERESMDEVIDDLVKFRSTWIPPKVEEPPVNAAA